MSNMSKKRGLVWTAPGFKLKGGFPYPLYEISVGWPVGKDVIPWVILKTSMITLPFKASSQLFKALIQ